MPKPNKKPRLTRRDLDVLRDALTFGIVVPELIAPYRFAGKAPGAVTSTLRRLYGHPPRFLYLRPDPLDDRRVYYRLTARGGRVIGATRAATLRPGKQSLVRRYALAWLVCCDKPHQRVLLDRAAVVQLLVSPGRMPKHGFYLHNLEGQPSRLGLAIVDHGAHPARLVRKAAKVAERLIENPSTREFVLARRLTLTLLTFDEMKREELDRTLRRRLHRQLRTLLWQYGVDARTQLPFAIETYTVPGLLPLIPHDHPGETR